MAQSSVSTITFISETKIKMNIELELWMNALKQLGHIWLNWKNKVHGM